MQVLGPVFSRDRQRLVASVIGSAMLLTFAVAQAAGSMSFNFFMGTLLTAAIAAVNLQLLLATLRREGAGKC